MMTWLLEGPWVLAGIGLVALAFPWIVYLRSRRVMWLGVMLAIVLVTAGVIGLERWVVTDREQVQQAVSDLAVALETDDRQGVLDLISDKAPELERDAAGKLRWIRVERAKVRNLKITLDEQPGTATATFRAGVHIRVRRQGGGRGMQLLRVELQFRRDQPAGPWRVSDYHYQAVANPAISSDSPG